MAVYKCKMCGGTLEIAEGMTVSECEYCGTKQTLPKAQDDATANLFNRANNLRYKSEFDKAQALYEKLVTNYPDDSESYWGLVLCKYGIEYVEDPATLKKIPTCHRTQLEPVQTDPDYLAALEHADFMQRAVYEQEAAEIDRLQKDILAIAQNEAPFDVFICYKETDADGKRTQDSVIANDIYYQLTQEGFKVFYAAITLEDKLGQAYEPYIYAALHSAKVMLVLGTRPEYFDAVWVRNEWSRYLKIVRADRNKLMIPCYRDMDAYELPEEFAHLQAQDMSKIGFINDVIRGIKKVLTVDKPETKIVKEVAQTSSSNIENLLKRGNLALEDGKWGEANSFFEQVLNENVEEYRAYIGLLCAEQQVISEEKLPTLKKDFTGSDYYRKACRFGGGEVENRLFAYNQQGLYDKYNELLSRASTEEACREAEKLFSSIGDFAGSAQKIEECREKAKKIRYDSAVRAMNNASDEDAFRNVQKRFEEFGDYLDAADNARKCAEKADEAKAAKEKADREAEERRKAALEAAEEAKRKRAQKTKRVAVICCVVAVIAAVGAVSGITIKESVDYKSAAKLLENGEYDKARDKYSKLNGYKDSKDMLTECNYQEAISFYNSKEYHKAYNEFKEISDYKESTDYLQKEEIAFYNKNIGDIISFGQYEWYIINSDDEAYTLLCKDSIGKKFFDYEHSMSAVKWDKCRLREVLNKDFYDEFSNEEKERILETNCINNDNMNINAEEKTLDYVYILSVDEAERLDTSILSLGTMWWLRTPGSNEAFVSVINNDGTINQVGDFFGVKNDVRPVIRIRKD